VDSLSKPTDFQLKRSKVMVPVSSFRTFDTSFTSVEWTQYKGQILRKMHYRRLLSEDQKLCRNAAGVAEYNSL